MEEAAAATLSDEEILERTDDASEKVRVSPLDPDFIIILFAIAVPADILDFILEWFNILILPKIVLTIVDIVVFIIVGGWIYWRTGKIAQSRKDFIEGLSKKSGKMAQQAGRMEKQLLKSPLGRVLVRAGLVFGGEIFLGLIPFWIILVVFTLREK